jgi:hypothetical protein
VGRRGARTGRILSGRGPRALAATFLLAGAAACGSNEPAVDAALVSTPAESFELVSHEGQKYVVGHGVLLEVPDGWTDYEPEKPSTDGTTSEWAVGEPEQEGELHAGVQFSMGKPGVGAGIDALPEAVREYAELSPGYEFVEEGEVDVPGAEEAAFLRFTRDLDFRGESYRLEQVMLMIEVVDGTTSTLRFLAPAGEWEESLGEVYDSVRVTASEQA